jgi:hypothetical protein
VYFSFYDDIDNFTHVLSHVTHVPKNSSRLQAKALFYTLYRLYDLTL